MPKIYFKKREKRPKTPGEAGIRFTSQRIPKEGILAIILGGVSIFIFLYLSFYSAYYRGEAGLIIGGIGSFAFFLSLTGFFLSLRTMKKDNVFLKVPIMGVVVNMISLIIYLVLYFYGLILMMV